MQRVRRTNWRSEQRGWNKRTLVRSAYRLASRPRRRARTGQRAPSCCSHRPAEDAYSYAQRIRGSVFYPHIYFYYPPSIYILSVDQSVQYTALALTRVPTHSLLADVGTHIEMWAHSEYDAQEEKALFKRTCPKTPRTATESLPLSAAVRLVYAELYVTTWTCEQTRPECDSQFSYYWLLWLSGFQFTFVNVIWDCTLNSSCYN